MKRLPLLLLSILLVFAGSARAAVPSEYIILIGGPSLHQWEQDKAQPHDHWWANFVHASRVRTEQLRAQLGPDAMITWLVYKPGYVDRGLQEKQDLIGNINSVRDKFHLNLVYFREGAEVINYLNAGQNRAQLKIGGFEYFGHSNKACFLFDYSNVIDSSSKSWMHESELTKINRGIFVHNAAIKSWGCHTGESMSKKWYAATGTRMLGAIGRTDFSTGELPIISTAGGKWVY